MVETDAFRKALRLSLRALALFWYGVWGFVVGHEGKAWIDAILGLSHGGHSLGLLALNLAKGLLLTLLGGFLTAFLAASLRASGVLPGVDPAQVLSEGRWGAFWGALAAFTPLAPWLSKGGGALLWGVGAGEVVAILFLFFAPLPLRKGG